MKLEYKKAIVIAKQLTNIRGIDHIITPGCNVYMASDWDGDVLYSVKKNGKNISVFDALGKEIKKKRVKPVNEDKAV